jgi:hypothetical protein
LTFESDSKLTRIEDQAFWGCGQLKSIRIPEGIQRLMTNWYLRSSLTRVIFESSVSLQTMIERRQIGVRGDFDICLVEWDGVISFPGYSVSSIPDVDRNLTISTWWRIEGVSKQITRKSLLDLLQWVAICQMSVNSEYSSVVRFECVFVTKSERRFSRKSQFALEFGNYRREQRVRDSHWVLEQPWPGRDSFPDIDYIIKRYRS